MNLLFSPSIFILNRPNDDISTHSSVKSQNKELILNSSSDNKDLGRVGFLIGGKKGRPMTDMNIIIDEVNNKIYDPMIDPEEYKKARKFLIFLKQANTE